MIVTKSIGTTGRDYSSISLWEADLDEATIYASGDEAVGEVYTDSAFDESPTIDGGGTVGLASITLTVPEGERHDGTAGTGARIVRSANAAVMTVSAAATVDGLEITCSVDVTNFTFRLLTLSSSVFATASKMLLYDWRTTHVTSDRGTAVSLGAENVLHNSIVYGIRKESGTGQVVGVLFELGTNAKLLNTTIHDVLKEDTNTGSGVLYVTGAGKVVQNVIVTDVSSCYEPAPSGSTVNHNASSDATATGDGSLIDIVTADQYVSTVVGSEDLHLKNVSVCIGAGTDLTATGIDGIELDIDGEARTGTWDIGADATAKGHVGGNINLLTIQGSIGIIYIQGKVDIKVVKGKINVNM